MDASSDCDSNISELNDSDFLILNQPNTSFNNPIIRNHNIYYYLINLINFITSVIIFITSDAIIFCYICYLMNIII